MNSVVSLRLDSEYSADRIARLFPKCKPKSSSSSSGTANASSSRLPLSPSSSSSNGTAISSSSSSTNGTISQSLPPPQQQQQQQHQHQSNVVENSKNMIVVNEVSSSLMDRNSPTVSTNGIRGSIESCETVEPNCNGTSVITEDSCSQASSYDMSNDEDSEEVPTPPSYRHSKSLSVHSMVNNNTITDNRDYRKPSKITAQYKLRDSRIIEIAGGRELYSQSRSKACRKSRSVDNDKGKLGRVWELRAKINNEKDSDGTREITETVFGSEIKSVKHQHIQSSYGVRGSVVFDDIGDNWRADQYSSSYSIQRTYHPNVTSLSQNFNQEIKTTSNNNEDRADNPSVITVPNHNNISNNNSNSYSNSNNNNNNNNNNSIEEIRDNNKLSLPHVIGNLPIAQYDGSPRRYGQRSAENMMPTLLSSPTMSAPRPGFPQRVVDNGGSTDGSTSPTLPVSNSSASMATFNYLYEYSETRKVLEEFFKDSDSQEKSEQQFQELEYELKRRKSPTSSTSYSRGNSYVGLRLADPTDNSSHCSPRKQSQDSSDGSVNNQDQGFMSSYTVSSENLGLSIDCNLPPTSIKPSAHHRFSLSPETERRFGQNRNFAMSPDTTDCDSNFGEGDSDVSSLMLIHDSESNVHQTNNNQLDRLYPSMPILEDGLSSGQNSDTEANNPTVLLMKKQITEIEREIIERNNRLPTTSNSNSANIVNSGSSSSVSTIIASSTAASTVISTPTNNITSIMSQSNNSSCSNGQNSYANIITSVSVPSPYPIVNNTENTSTSDIDLNSLDPLAIIPDRCNASPPPPAPVAHRDVRHQSVAVSSQINNSSCVEDTIKDIRMTLSRTKALPIRAASCIVNGDMEKESVSSNSKPENPVWIPRKKSSISGQSADEDEPDTDLETDRLLGQQRTDDQGFFDDKIGWKKKSRSLLPFGLGTAGSQLANFHSNSTSILSTPHPVLMIKRPPPVPSTEPVNVANGSLSLSPLRSPSPPSSPSTCEYIENNSSLSSKKDVGEENKKKAKNKEGLFHEPSVLIEGVLFRARYLGSTQLVCEGQPTKATRMMQAEEAVSRIKVDNHHHAGCKKAGTSFEDESDESEDIFGTNLGPGRIFRLRLLGSVQVDEEEPMKRKPNVMRKRLKKAMVEEAVIKIKAPDGESQPSTDVDLFISTEKIMVLNTDLKEIMMDHALRTISYIADIGDLVVLMARRRFVPHDVENPPKINRTPKMICHVFESDEAQFIAQSIGQAFQVAYMEFLKANGIEDHSFVKEMDYQEVLNSQEIFGDELQMFARKELQKEVVVPKMKGEILGVVIVESGWGSMLPTVVIANLAPSGAAARCGQLNIGDQIIAINGVSLVGLPLSTCQNYIKNSKPHTVIKLTVVPCAPVVEVKIKRPDTKYQLGFSVQNGVICSLLRGGIAERGGVRVGHRIIEINNQSVVAVPHEKIVTLLATSVGEILMKTMPTSMFRLLTGQETPAFI